MLLQKKIKIIAKQRNDETRGPKATEFKVDMLIFIRR